jgi:hypothetical protein
LRPITLHGLRFEFKKDKDPRCASFAHVLAAIDATVDVLEEIFLANEVRMHGHIEDLYTKLNPS